VRRAAGVRPRCAVPCQRPSCARRRTAAFIGYIGAVVAILLFFTLTSFWVYHLVRRPARPSCTPAGCSADRLATLGGQVNDGDQFVSRAGDLLDFFIIAVTLLVVAVPEVGEQAPALSGRLVERVACAGPAPRRHGVSGLLHGQDGTRRAALRARR
jgi:hypothetical protein